MSDPYMIAVGIIGERPLTDGLLKEVLELLPRILPNLGDTALSDTRKQLESTIGIQVTAGEGLHDIGQDPWLGDAKANINWDYWEAYKKQLAAARWPRDVIRVLDEDTDNVLNECGDPRRGDPWQIKGLVMGDVQSGKTANYCGLINKAADAGYRFIVLLTGMLEDLRAQSQERMDEGFVGRDSRAMIGGTRPNQRFGAGRFRERVPNVLTSVDSDFLTGNSRALGGIPLRNIAEPVLLVMKKNKTPLSRLIEFIDSQTPSGTGKLDMPMLLLDDEADSASVNARKDEDPATINRLIREVINKFRRSSYVAYTATPFANVFINPDFDDLFPANFVYTLNTPSNYIGVSTTFGDDAPHAYQVVDILDAATAFPKGHKKGWEVSALPESLGDAVGTFLLSCAVRDLRAEPLRHRSMLVNVTTLTSVQRQVADMLKTHLYEVLEDIKQYVADSMWSRHPNLSRLATLWDEQYGDLEYSWDQIRAILHDATASIKVITVNQETLDSEKLDYTAYKDTSKGRRVIAVGGLALSRGLTLEGLCVSYFYRRSKAYDTLLQMGRWFGYRPGYQDLCRVWMDPDVQDSFSHIATVVDELRIDIKRMHAAKQPPRMFGMRVRSHPDTLIVTSLNKMRNAQEVEIEVSFSGKLAETPFLIKDVGVNARNLRVVADFLATLGGSMLQGSRFRWSAEASKIAGFLSQLQISPANTSFIPDLRTGVCPLIQFVGDNEHQELRTWDVCLVQGDGTEIPSVSIATPSGISRPQARRRQFEVVPKAAPYLKLNKQRVGDVSDEMVGLDDIQIADARAEWEELRKSDPTKGVRPSGVVFRSRRPRPLLTINLIEPTAPREGTKAAGRMMSPDQIDAAVFVALSLSFPNFQEREGERVLYQLNKVALKNMGLLEEEADDED